MLGRVKNAIAAAVARVPHNRHTCRLLTRIDAALHALKGKPVYWSSDGALCERMPKGHGVELRTHFPDRAFAIACDVQNRHRWTRRFLSV